MNRSRSAGSSGGSVNGADVTLCMMFPSVRAGSSRADTSAAFLPQKLRVEVERRQS